DLLGTPLGLRLGRDGIELGGIKNGDAAINGIIHLGVTFSLGGLFAEGHGAETDGADFYAGAAKLTIFHAALANIGGGDFLGDGLEISRNTCSSANAAIRKSCSASIKPLR